MIRQLAEYYDVSFSTIYSVYDLSRWVNIGEKYNDTLFDIRSPYRHLNRKEVWEIHYHYHAIGLETAQIAEMYNKRQGVISSVIQGHTYKEIYNSFHQADIS